MKKGDLTVIDCKGKQDRRRYKQKINWISEEKPYTEGPAGLLSEQRLDVDTQRVLAQLLRMVRNREINGLVFGAIRKDGGVDVGFSGSAYDNAVMAAGAASRLKAVLDSWPDHPGDYLPEFK